MCDVRVCIQDYVRRGFVLSHTHAQKNTAYARERVCMWFGLCCENHTEWAVRISRWVHTDKTDDQTTNQQHRAPMSSDAPRTVIPPSIEVEQLLNVTDDSESLWSAKPGD